MYDGVFKACGNTVLIAGTSDASAAQQISTGSVSSVRFYVPAGNAWVAMGGTTSVTAVVPTTAAPSNGVMLPTGIPTVLDVGNNAYVSAVSSAGATALVYLTPGLGGKV